MGSTRSRRKGNLIFRFSQQGKGSGEEKMEVRSKTAPNKAEESSIGLWCRIMVLYTLIIKEKELVTVLPSFVVDSYPTFSNVLEQLISSLSTPFTAVWRGAVEAAFEHCELPVFSALSQAWNEGACVNIFITIIGFTYRCTLISFIICLCLFCLVTLILRNLPPNFLYTAL